MSGDETSATRKLFIVLSARSLPYAKLCIASLFRNAIESLDLTLITDDESEKDAIQQVMRSQTIADRHRWRVYSKADADMRAEGFYADFSAVARFRQGHPCWRKITDPPLFASPSDEIIILDPDVYFPNRFTFEPTPTSGILLMRQRPNCLLPESVVRTAYAADIAMADYTDIGVCQFRTPLDFVFIDRLIEDLGGANLPRSMHVESIVWAALAEHSGGGYLDPVAWRCFDNSVLSRMERRMGRTGVTTLGRLDFGQMKCFHAGGVAKYWLAEAENAGQLSAGHALAASTPVQAFVRYPKRKFERKIVLRQAARALGAYRVLGSG
jgi:hypothetical protein